MHPLPHKSLREYRAGVVRRTLKDSLLSAFADRKMALAFTTATFLLVNPAGPPTDDVLVRSAAPALATYREPPAAIIPSLFSMTEAGGPAYGYAQRLLSAGNEVHLDESTFKKIEVAWSAAFFGDKQRMAEFIEHSALSNGLPVDFLMRLLRQESGLNHQAVSSAGALGVAQFMPATASERGLVDPFDPFEAIPKSAELLREHRARFGNLGFAAAAYNAGPQRVRDWLSGRSTLPRETREYVEKITGRTADDWRKSGDLFAVAEDLVGRLRH